MEVLQVLLKPQMIISMLVGIAVFATIIAVVMPYFSTGRLNDRIKYVSSERDRLRQQRLQELASSSATLRHQTNEGMAKKVVNKFNLREQLQTEDLTLKLKMAGFRGPKPVVTYLFAQFCLPILGLILAGLYVGLGQNTYSFNNKLMIIVGAVIAGFYLPRIYLSNLITKRKASIKQAFPDALDLLLICVQSGMSVEAAFQKVSAEIGEASPELMEEFSLTTAEMSYLPKRRMAYENLAVRTGLPGVKAVATTLIQTERYGTPLATALRAMASEFREQRMMEAERKAAALPPKLTVPMIVFFLPVLFIVILGPSAIAIMKVK